MSNAALSIVNSKVIRRAVPADNSGNSKGFTKLTWAVIDSFSNIDQEKLWVFD